MSALHLLLPKPHASLHFSIRIRGFQKFIFRSLWKLYVMRLPIIKHLNEFIKNNDEDYLNEAIQVIEDLADAKGIKDEELEVMGELLSNMYGALEVRKLIADDGMSDKDALNAFMKRVVGSIEK